MVDALAEKIHDNRFLRLVQNMLQAGYLEDWIWGATLSGAPQGGVVSPILSNVYLHKLDYFVERILIPHYTRGERRASNPAYKRIASAIERAASTVTARKYGSCASGSACCPAWIRRIRDTGGCDTYDMPTITSSGLPDQNPRPRRSKHDWPGSCEKTSSWN
jgi:hypothetical protein